MSDKQIIRLDIQTTEAGLHTFKIILQVDHWGNVHSVELDKEGARKVWENLAPYFDGREVAEV